MATTSAERHLRKFVDEVYGEPASEDPLGVLGPLYTALRKEVSFSSGTFLHFNPSDWTVSAPYTHDIGPDLMQTYTDHYCRLDPYRIQLPNLKHPNQVARMSDFVDVDQVFRGEFGEAMRRAGYFHCMAMVPFVRGSPVGAFGVQRPRSKHDFDRKEQEVFQWFVFQAAKAMDYRRLVARLHRVDPATMIVAPSERRVLALTEGTRALLADLPEGSMLTVPSDSQHCCLCLVGAKTNSVRSVELDPESLLGSAAIANLSFNTVPDLTDAKVRFAPGNAQGRALVLIEPIEGVDHARGKLSGFGLTPRQEQVAVLLVLRKGLKEIARTCGISVNTAKEYVADVYERLDVHSRAAFLAKLTGVASAGGRRTASLG